MITEPIIVDCTATWRMAPEQQSPLDFFQRNMNAAQYLLQLYGMVPIRSSGEHTTVFGIASAADHYTINWTWSMPKTYMGLVAPIYRDPRTGTIGVLAAILTAMPRWMPPALVRVTATVPSAGNLHASRPARRPAAEPEHVRWLRVEGGLATADDFRDCPDPAALVADFKTRREDGWPVGAIVKHYRQYGTPTQETQYRGRQAQENQPERPPAPAARPAERLHANYDASAHGDPWAYGADLIASLNQ